MSARRAYGAAKQTVENAERASRAAADSAEQIRGLVPTKRQAKLLAAGGVGALTAGPAAGSYYGSKRGTKVAQRQQSMQRVGKRGEWKTIEDLKDDRRDGRQRQRTGAKVLSAGVGVGATAYKMGGGPAGLKREFGAIRSSASRGMRGPFGLAATTVRNPAGAAAVGAGLTIATGATVNGIGSRQARVADQAIKRRRQENFRRQQQRSQLLHVRKADVVMRYGNGGSVGRKIADPYESFDSVEKGLRLPKTKGQQRRSVQRTTDKIMEGVSNARAAGPQRGGAVLGQMRANAAANGHYTRPGQTQALYDNTRKTLPNYFGKADRRYDPDAKRRHNQGAVTGASATAGAAGLVAGGRQVRRETQALRSLGVDLSGLRNAGSLSGKTADALMDLRKKKALMVSRGAGTKLAAGGGLLAVAGANRKRAKSDRNRTWG